MRWTCWITGILVASFAAPWTGVSMAGELASNTATMVYPTPLAHGQLETLIRDPVSREVFVVSLIPDRDILGQVGMIDLALHRLSDRPDARNLLEPRGNWHGMEPFMFAASDLVAGREAANYGRLRTILAPRIDAYLNIEVDDVMVDKSSGDGGAIKRLSLSLRLIGYRPSPPDGTLSAGSVAAKFIDHGAPNTIKELRTRDQWNFVLNRISEGRVEWIALAPYLAPGSDAGSAKDLEIALAHALTLNAPAVLERLDPLDGPVIGIDRVCSALFVEKVTDVRAYRRKAITAVTRVKDPSLEWAKKRCLAVLEKPD